MSVGFGRSRRSSFFLRCLLFMVAVFLGLGYLFPVLDSVKDLKFVASSLSFCNDPTASTTKRRPSVKGPPTKSFRDNLLNDTYYITGWSTGGLTNAVMNFANMIYLGKLTDRVPIVPPFAPAQHISSTAGIIPFGDIFDLPVLRKALEMDVLDWREVKDIASRDYSDPYSPDEIDELGCWTTIKESSRDPTTGNNIVRHLGLDNSYTRLPPYVRLATDVPAKDEPHVILPHLAAVVFPVDPLVDAESTTVLTPAPRSGHVQPPDHQLSCFDSLYYASSGPKPFEWERSWSPVWRTVGRHLRFTAAMEEIASAYMVRAFKLSSPTEKAPPFVAVHIRRGDFVGQCKSLPKTKTQEGDDCFPSLFAYEKHVEDTIEDLWLIHDIYVPNVIVMSDETSPSFWGKVRERGWFFVNHTEAATAERYGEWYLPLIDIVIQSHAVGFVGTKSSTFSLLGGRRVQDWNGGIVREVSIRDNK